MTGTSKFDLIRTDLSAAWLTSFQVKVIPGKLIAFFRAFFRAENAQVDSLKQFQKAQRLNDLKDGKK
jgi:hypothetical protein